MTIKYTYIRHPLCPAWVLTIARRWDNAEKTRLRIAWCANKTDYHGWTVYHTLDAFDKRQAHLICTGRLNSASSVIMEFSEPHKTGVSPPLVPRIVEFVQNHPKLPNQLRRLMQHAALAEYKELPATEWSTSEWIKYLKK